MNTSTQDDLIMFELDEEHLQLIIKKKVRQALLHWDHASNRKWLLEHITKPRPPWWKNKKNQRRRGPRKNWDTEEALEELANEQKITSSMFHSQYRNVYYDYDRQKWFAQITVDGEKILIDKDCDTEIEAAMAYDIFVLKYKPRGRPLNFPKETYENKFRD